MPVTAAAKAPPTKKQVSDTGPKAATVVAVVHPNHPHTPLAGTGAVVVTEDATPEIPAPAQTDATPSVPTSPQFDVNIVSIMTASC